MATVFRMSSLPDNLAELVDGLGKIPLDRIMVRPAVGTATEEDMLVAQETPRKRLCELVDGVLVEKPVGAEESLIAGILLSYLWEFLRLHNLGIALGADGMIKLWPGLVRIPDLCYIPRERLPGGKLPKKKIAEIVPDLVVEVLSVGNTKKEMLRKRREYFLAGVRLVWEINPRKRFVDVYTSVKKFVRIDKQGTLEGGDVLPGFTLLLQDLFAETA
jgi:Uma2 family endonuclease